jgi:hypothetical protein
MADAIRKREGEIKEWDGQGKKPVNYDRLGKWKLKKELKKLVGVEYCENHAKAAETAVVLQWTNNEIALREDEQSWHIMLALVEEFAVVSGTFLQVLCTVGCGLWAVYCVLCTVYCVLWAVYCVLCTVYCVLCTVYCVLCTVYCVLHLFFSLVFFTCALHLFFSLVFFTCFFHLCSSLVFFTCFFSPVTLIIFFPTTVQLLYSSLTFPQDIIKDSFKGSLSARERAETDSGVVFSQVSPYPHHNNEATAEEMTQHMRVASKEIDMHHAVYVRMLRIQNARRAELREALDYWYVCGGLWGYVWVCVGMCGYVWVCVGVRHKCCKKWK